MIKISNILEEIEKIAHPSLQESYDNAQLITGDINWDCSGVILCLDAIEAVIDEAIEKKCNLVIAHHPIVFSGLKSITGKNYIERTIIKAIKNDIAIYAAHTNLDNVIEGVNKKIADKLSLKNIKILAPKKGLLKKLYTYVPQSSTHIVRDKLFQSGAGNVGNYSECSFKVMGTGTFKGNEQSQPYIGERGQLHEEREDKIEFLFPAYLEPKILKTLFEVHPYEEVAYEIITLDNIHHQIGSGMIGQLDIPVDTIAFLNQIKNLFDTPIIRHTQIVREKVQKIAICGGAGSFLLNEAIRQKADVFITGDYKYHQFFDADNQIVIADIGHFESEQYTIELFYEILIKKFSNFALYLTTVSTNPVKYL
ncbi:MAG: Nif3-like dinuclear metal center hexameric protein [Chitinophagales bacterium]|nr:Nif3-like dinuclear metal center hexameric protein [Chitinophagales bacterium]MCZ2392842.1 Nif3-like dinuclear metal center hexameric protein [Chitinophagales bacterium]